MREEKIPARDVPYGEPFSTDGTLYHRVYHDALTEDGVIWAAVFGSGQIISVDADLTVSHVAF